MEQVNVLRVEKTIRYLHYRGWKIFKMVWLYKKRRSHTNGRGEFFTRHKSLWKNQFFRWDSL